MLFSRKTRTKLRNYVFHIDGPFYSVKIAFVVVDNEISNAKCQRQSVQTLWLAVLLVDIEKMWKAPHTLFTVHLKLLRALALVGYWHCACEIARFYPSQRMSFGFKTQTSYSTSSDCVQFLYFVPVGGYRFVYVYFCQHSVFPFDSGNNYNLLYDVSSEAFFYEMCRVRLDSFGSGARKKKQFMPKI